MLIEVKKKKKETEVTCEFHTGIVIEDQGMYRSEFHQRSRITSKDVE